MVERKLTAFRIGADGKIKETQYQLSSREEPSRLRKAGSGQVKLAPREAPSRPRKAGSGTPWGESAWGLRPAKPTGLWRLGLGRQRLSVVLTGWADGAVYWHPLKNAHGAERGSALSGHFGPVFCLSGFSRPRALCEVLRLCPSVALRY